MNPHNGRRQVVGYAFDQATRELLTKVVAIYSRLSASTLRDLSHASGGPWDRVWNHGGKISPGMRFNNEDIVRFYARMPWPATVQ